jgi:hypothetical protein
MIAGMTASEVELINKIHFIYKKEYVKNFDDTFG